MKNSIQSFVLLIPLLIVLTCFNDTASALAWYWGLRQQGEVLLDEFITWPGEYYGQSLSAFRVMLDLFAPKP